MTVEDVVQGVFRRLCAHRRAEGVATDMSLAELRLALGVTEKELMEGIKVLRLSGDLFIAYTTRARDRVALGRRGGTGARTRRWRGSDMPKPKKKAGGRVVKMSPLVIARIEAELLVLAAKAKARVPDLTPAMLQALKKRLRRAMGLIQ